MKKLICLFVLINIFSFLNVKAQDANKKCYICHSQSTLSIKDSTFGIIKNFYVDSVAYNKSHHAYLNCIDCHSQDFNTIPHSKTALSEQLKCMDCHDEDLVIKGRKFDKINSDFKKSVHYRAFGNKLSCTFCHNPHTIQLKTSSLWKIRNTYPVEDQMCVECHDTEYKWFQGGSQRVDLKAIHSTIDNIKDWQEKKCIDCHTKDNSSHNIIFLSGLKNSHRK